VEKGRVKVWIFLKKKIRTGIATGFLKVLFGQDNFIESTKIM
jgi:hypothetical protein